MVKAQESEGTITERGRAIYESVVAPQLSDDDRGVLVAIDVNTGEWEIDDERDATLKLREREPDADVFLLRHIDIVTGYMGGVPIGLLNEDRDG